MSGTGVVSQHQVSIGGGQEQQYIQDVLVREAGSWPRIQSLLHKRPD